MLIRWLKVHDQLPTAEEPVASLVVRAVTFTKRGRDSHHDYQTHPKKPNAGKVVDFSEVPVEQVFGDELRETVSADYEDKTPERPKYLTSYLPSVIPIEWLETMHYWAYNVVLGVLLLDLIGKDPEPCHKAEMTA